MNVNPPTRRSTHSALRLALDLRRVRRGLTLLELMIALSLLSVLILVAWSLFNSLAMVDEKGNAQIKRVQVLRGLQSIIAEDLNARVREAPQEYAAPQRAQATLGFGELTRANQGFGDQGSGSIGMAPAPPTKIHFVGTAQSLEFAIMSPPTLRERVEFQDDLDPANRELDGSALYGSETGSDSRIDNGGRSAFDESSSASGALGTQQVSVKYQFDKTIDGTTGGLTRVIRGQSHRTGSSGSRRLPTSRMSSNDPLSDQTSSLEDASMDADRVLDASDLYGVDASSELGSFSEKSSSRSSRQRRLEFPEVGDLQFRYHDGQQWLDEWDAQNMGSYPAAVEIQFELLTNKELQEIREEAAERAEMEGSDELSELNADLMDSEETLDTDLESTLDGALSTTGDSEIRLPYRVIIPIEPLVAKELMRQRMPSDEFMDLQGGLR